MDFPACGKFVTASFAARKAAQVDPTAESGSDYPGPTFVEVYRIFLLLVVLP